MAPDDPSGKCQPLITGKKLRPLWTGSWCPRFHLPFRLLIVPFWWHNRCSVRGSGRQRPIIPQEALWGIMWWCGDELKKHSIYPAVSHWLGSTNKCRCPTSSSKPQPYPITAWHRAPRRNDRLSQHPRSPVLCTLTFLTPLHTGATATQTLLCHTRLIIAAYATLFLSFMLLSFLRQRVWGPLFLLLWVHVGKKKFLLLWSKWEQRECNFASLTLGVTSLKSAF